MKINIFGALKDAFDKLAFKPSPAPTCGAHVDAPARDVPGVAPQVDHNIVHAVLSGHFGAPLQSLVYGEAHDLIEKYGEADAAMLKAIIHAKLPLAVSGLIPFLPVSIRFAAPLVLPFAEAKVESLLDHAIDWALHEAEAKTETPAMTSSLQEIIGTYPSPNAPKATNVAPTQLNAQLSEIADAMQKNQLAEGS